MSSRLLTGLTAGYGGSAEQTGALVRAQAMVLNFVVIYEMILTFVIRGSYRVPFFSNGWAWAAAGLVLALQALLMYTPMADLFGIVPLRGFDLGILLLAGILFSAVSFFYRKMTAAVPSSLLPLVIAAIRWSP